MHTAKFSIVMQKSEIPWLINMHYLSYHRQPNLAQHNRNCKNHPQSSPQHECTVGKQLLCTIGAAFQEQWMPRHFWMAYHAPASVPPTKSFHSWLSKPAGNPVISMHDEVQLFNCHNWVYWPERSVPGGGSGGRGWCSWGGRGQVLLYRDVPLNRTYRFQDPKQSSPTAMRKQFRWAA